MSIQVVNAILDSVRSRLSGVADDQIKLELFNTCDELAREALGAAAPVDPDAAPETWLSSALWAPNYSVLLDGTLFRLYAQNGKPWASAELATAHAQRYSTLLTLARTDAASQPATVYQRLLNAVRVQVPTARESAVTLAAFTVANKIRTDALQIESLGDDVTDPQQWLPAWDVAYQAMLYGTLSRLQLQVGQPWSNAEAANANNALFLEELNLLRGDQAKASSAGIDRLMDLARVRLPGARDNIIKLELFQTVDEFFRETNIWTEDVPFDVDPATTTFQEDPFSFTYPVTASGGVVRLLGVWNAQGVPQNASMPVPGEVVIPTPPTKTETFTARLTLTVRDPVDKDGFPFMPVWILRKYGNDFLDGLLGRMMSQTAKPYSSPPMAVAHMRQFKYSTSKAKVEVKKQNVYAKQTWRFPQSFNRRR